MQQYKVLAGKSRDYCSTQGRRHSAAH